jgi:hypothetical protein
MWGLDLAMGTTPLITSSVPPYESLAPTKDANKHELLFWGGREGPGYVLFTLRSVMLMGSVSAAVIYTWLSKKPDDIYGVLFAFAPIMHILLTLPYAILPHLVLATGIEQAPPPPLSPPLSV